MENNTTTKRGRNWTKEETELFVEVITDTNEEDALILERKALKKASNKLVFEEIMLNKQSFHYALCSVTTIRKDSKLLFHTL